jgi:hypothetical protein
VPSSRLIQRIARKEYMSWEPVPLNEMLRNLTTIERDDPSFYIRWYFGRHPDQTPRWLERLRAA